MALPYFVYSGRSLWPPQARRGGEGVRGRKGDFILSCGLAVVHKEGGEGEEDGEAREGVVSNFSRLSPILPSPLSPASPPSSLSGSHLLPLWTQLGISWSVELPRESITNSVSELLNTISTVIRITIRLKYWPKVQSSLLRYKRYKT